MAFPVLSSTLVAFTSVTGIELTDGSPMLNIMQFEQNGRVMQFRALLKNSTEITPARDAPTAPAAGPAAGPTAATAAPVAAPAGTGILASAPLVTGHDALAAGTSSAAAALTCGGALAAVTAAQARALSSEMWLEPEVALEVVAGGPTVMPTVLRSTEVAPEAVSMMLLAPTPTVAPAAVAGGPPSPTVALEIAASSSAPSAAIPKICALFPKPHVVAEWKPHTDIRLQKK